jgi:hypothetical protein
VNGNEVTVTANTVQRAMGNGIDIGGPDFLGTVAGNTISEAQTGIQGVLGGLFSGTIRGNSLTASRVNGIYFEAGLFDDGSEVSDNTIEKSGAEGMILANTGLGPSLLDVTNNTLTLNNVFQGVQHGEFVARLGSDAGPWTIQLSGNRNYNLPPPGEFNFDFLDLGGHGLVYLDDGTNVGTFGSSDFSVPPPP